MYFIRKPEHTQKESEKSIWKLKKPEPQRPWQLREDEQGLEKSRAKS